MIHISVEWDGWCNTWRRGVDGVELDFLKPLRGDGGSGGRDLYLSHENYHCFNFFPIEKNTQLLIAEL